MLYDNCIVLLTLEFHSSIHVLEAASCCSFHLNPVFLGLKNVEVLYLGDINLLFCQGKSCTLDLGDEHA